VAEHLPRQPAHDLPDRLLLVVGRHHDHDAVEVRLPDAPLPDEIVVIVAVANRGRINARLGGMSVADVVGQEGE
jgi:hypothetical protein